tara:strand:+ start:139086 stop:139340 length:255 start_codon:yes stop_codon:yes gene_type:complete
MDPLATLRIINDLSGSADDRLSHLHYLAEWLARGGFVPHEGTLTEETVVFAEDSGSGVLVASVNVALVNADLSGLEGAGYKVLR